jgi:heterodisulfide reductase subunit A-like polyferredoxin
MFESTEVVQSDVLVIGGSIGGLVASINARKQGVDVLVVDKGGIGWAGQVPISGGRSMVILPDESVDALGKATTSITRTGPTISGITCTKPPWTWPGGACRSLAKGTN